IETRLRQPKAVATAIPTTSPIAQPVRQCVVAESAARLRFDSAGACKAVDRVEQFLALLQRRFRIPGRESVGDTVVDVTVEHLEGEILERGVHGRDLSEDVDAVAIVLHHPLDAAYLSFDPVEPLDQRVLVVPVLHRASRVLRNPRSRSEFVTTKTLENAIAAAARIGLR